MKTTPLWAKRHPLSQKRRRSSRIPSRFLPAYLARIQRISRFQVKLSTALKAAADTPCRKWFAHPRRDLFRIKIILSRS